MHIFFSTDSSSRTGMKNVTTAAVIREREQNAWQAGEAGGVAVLDWCRRADFAANTPCSQ